MTGSSSGSGLVSDSTSALVKACPYTTDGGSRMLLPAESPCSGEDATLRRLGRTAEPNTPAGMREEDERGMRAAVL